MFYPTWCVIAAFLMIYLATPYWLDRVWLNLSYSLHLLNTVCMTSWSPSASSRALGENSVYKPAHV
ncbi:hypothetical protein DSM109990_01803 [Sulfitobacter dubius]|uniref:Uncharacterized protein n=1 Tax=Sulfitobacter dubius TaxID=218673 RepID=A0ABY3ZMK7_9RHOB|nr:hypothetical protein DSM109990_01803 [Sulfitobacter dubius]